MTLHENESLTELVEEARALLGACYQKDPSHLAAAPGRVNLIGEHIDYCDGLVLPLAIDRHIVIAATPNGSDKARIRSRKDSEVVLCLQSSPQPGAPSWANYLRGILEGFRLRELWPVPGFDAVITSDRPIGAGLSSSAALELAFASILESMVQTVLDPREKALLCQQAEHNFAGVPCGIMDQFACSLGQRDHLVLIDCQTHLTELVPFDSRDLSILVANTMVSHDLASGEYGKRREETDRALNLLGKQSWRHVLPADLEVIETYEDGTLFRRALHVVSEITRTKKAAKALRDKEYAVLGSLMSASHQSLRDDFEVSCLELDLMVELANQIGPAGGVLGSRMTGGGFGGSTVTLCHGKRVHEISEYLSKAYEVQSGKSPQIFATRPAQGARLL